MLNLSHGIPIFLCREPTDIRLGPASVYKDLKIAGQIDAVLGADEKRVVTAGQAFVAMILNGLGYTDRRLYITSQFFESRPVAMLLGADIKASELNDYTLCHSLDQIADFGSSPLFASVVFGIAIAINQVIDC